MMVVDASVLATALADDTDEGDSARERLREDPDLHAPNLVDLEVLSTFRHRARAGELDGRRAALAVEDLASLPLQRYPHHPFLERVWELRGNLTPYDAAYVALAEMIGCVLVTADARLARAPAVHCEIEVVATRE
ncbi:MAG: type II toxin-antitoxin system VapC family toxin [Nitriliruptorales bacterium]